MYPYGGSTVVLVITWPRASSQMRRERRSGLGTMNAAYFLPSTTRGVTSSTEPSDRTALRCTVPGLTWRAYPSWRRVRHGDPERFRQRVGQADDVVTGPARGHGDGRDVTAVDGNPADIGGQLDEREAEPGKSTAQGDPRIVARPATGPVAASSSRPGSRDTMAIRTSAMRAVMDDERENLSWQAFGDASRELAKVIATDRFEPDLILSIARGGLFLAASLGYALAVKNLHVTNVEFYDGVGTTLDMPVMLPPVPSAVDFSAKKVLIADDVADSGRTMELVRAFIKDHVEDVRTAVIYEKPRSLIKCDYVWKRTDRWINFPWSVEGPVVQRAGQVLDA
jgi:hypoxanthine phosphoribosyltransferase